MTVQFSSILHAVATGLACAGRKDLFLDKNEKGLPLKQILEKPQIHEVKDLSIKLFGIPFPTCLVLDFISSTGGWARIAVSSFRDSFELWLIDIDTGFAQSFNGTIGEKNGKVEKEAREKRIRIIENDLLNNDLELQEKLKILEKEYKETDMTLAEHDRIEIKIKGKHHCGICPCWTAYDHDPHRGRCKFVRGWSADFCECQYPDRLTLELEKTKINENS